MNTAVIQAQIDLVNAQIAALPFTQAVTAAQTALTAAIAAANNIPVNQTPAQILAAKLAALQTQLAAAAQTATPPTNGLANPAPAKL